MTGILIDCLWDLGRCLPWLRPATNWLRVRVERRHNRGWAEWR